MFILNDNLSVNKKIRTYSVLIKFNVIINTLIFNAYYPQYKSLSYNLSFSFFSTLNH